MLKLGTKNIRAIYNGTTDIDRVMYGESLVWEKLKTVDLGTRVFSNYDITSIYPDYGNLTVDNFFILGMENATGSSRVTVSGSTLYLSLTGKLYKSYNASTGRLTCYNQMTGNNTSANAKVHVVIVSDPSRLTSLGSAQSFNVTNVDGYRDFTVDSFLIKNCSQYFENHARTENGTWTATGTMKLYKTYNPSKGLLTCYYYEEGSNNANTVDFKMRKQNVEAYLLP